jgi:hypothetical protein
MTRYAVIELGKVLGLWLAVTVVLVAGAGLLLWLAWFAAAHALAWVYRRRGYRAVVTRDGIEIRIRRWPKLFQVRPITNVEYAEFAAKWTAAHGNPGRNAHRVKVVGSTDGGLS